ncbi:MAG TPA: hypothetical protein VFI54_26385 [Solirubrobacteraceae bacterium]|nr:hypothetical protein [Solirubrobacteraceae bacterium]
MALSGTGGGLPAGPAGATGKTGSPGMIEIVTCRPVTKVVTIHGKRQRKKLQQCKAKLVSGSIIVSGTQAAAARLTRGRVVYAVGREVGNGSNRTLLLTPSRLLTRGVYTLTLTSRHGRRTTTTHQRITISRQ